MDVAGEKVRKLAWIEPTGCRAAHEEQGQKRQGWSRDPEVPPAILTGADNSRVSLGRDSDSHQMPCRPCHRAVQVAHAPFTCVVQ